MRREHYNFNRMARVIESGIKLPINKQEEGGVDGAEFSRVIRPITPNRLRMYLYL